MANKFFTFSCDSHFVEPNDLYTSNMPASLKDYALYVKVENGILISMMGDKVLYKFPIIGFDHKVGAGVSLGDGAVMKPQGQRDLSKRLADMARDGVDAELVFPTIALTAAMMDNRDAAVATAHIYNDWIWDYVEGYRATFVPAAFMPLSGFDELLAEIARAAAKGFRAIMLPPCPPDSLPGYTDPAWDPVFAACAEADATIVSHTATGKVPVKALTGPGGAVYNYTRQMTDAMDATTRLVAGGVLDRNPKARIMFAECGAGWLLPLGERMDETYVGHAPMVKPKLGRLPSQIVKDQVYSSFQNDTSCLLNRKVLGLKNMVFATDYPHSEGTFPTSQNVIEEMFTKVPDLTDDEKAAVLGLNAASLFHVIPEQAIAEKKHAAA